MEATWEQKPLNLWSVITESRRVIKSERLTFLALAFLFLFPSSLAAVLYPITVKSLSGDKAPAKIVLAVAYYLFSLLFLPLAIGSITYTALHGFNGEPVKVKAAVKSLAASYFPLLATGLSVQLIVFSDTFSFALFTTVCIATGVLGKTYLLGFAAAIFVSVMLYLHVNWILASAVTVSESSSGFAALKRSKILIEGKRGLALCLSLIFVLFYLVLFSSNYYTTELVVNFDGLSRPFVAAELRIFFILLTLQFLSTAFSVMLIHMYSVIAGAVLYVYCRAIEKAGGEYFSLPVDDDKLASVV